MKIINLFGGPGVGKSTLAAGVFSLMKLEGKDVELVTEYAKELVWESVALENLSQLNIFANQYKRIARLDGKVEYVVTDSPLLLSSIYLTYNMDFDPALDKVIVHAHRYWETRDFLVKRDPNRRFTEVGRWHNVTESDRIGEACAALLDKLGSPYTLVPGNKTGITSIMQGVDNYLIHDNHKQLTKGNLGYNMRWEGEDNGTT